MNVDLSGVSLELFVTNAIFLLLIFSMLSMVVVRLFQHRKRSASVYGGLGILFIAAFTVVLKTWFM